MRERWPVSRESILNSAHTPFTVEPWPRFPSQPRSLLALSTLQWRQPLSGSFVACCSRPAPRRPGGDRLAVQEILEDVPVHVLGLPGHQMHAQGAGRDQDPDEPAERQQQPAGLAHGLHWRAQTHGGPCNGDAKDREGLDGVLLGRRNRTHVV